MTFKATVFSIFLLSACVILTTKNPITTSFSSVCADTFIDATDIEDTAISVSLSVVDFPVIEAKSTEFLCPISSQIVTSIFGTRTHPLTLEQGFHTGIDLASADDLRVFSIADGEIIDTGFDDIYGNYVRISHANGYESFYAHLSEICASGDVLQGDVVGIIGETGLATGEHLHFEISQNGELLDPSTVIDFYEN